MLRLYDNALNAPRLPHERQLLDGQTDWEAEVTSYVGRGMSLLAGEQCQRTVAPLARPQLETLKTFCVGTRRTEKILAVPPPIVLEACMAFVSCDGARQGPGLRASSFLYWQYRGRTNTASALEQAWLV